MLGLGLSLSLGQRKRGGAALAVPVPPNNKMALWLDSRSAQAASAAALTNANTRGVLRGVAFGPNVCAIDPRLEMGDDFTNTLGANYSGGRADWTANMAFLSDFGISGDRVDTAYGNDPRKPAGTAGSELSFKALLQNPCGIVLALAGVNNMKVGWTATDTYGYLKSAATDLTNPTLNGGVQKVFVLLDELPWGVYPGGGTGANTPGSPERTQMAAYSLLLRQLDYRSGHADSLPYCIVINVYDWATTGGAGGAIGNRDGLLYDGLHPGCAGAPLIAQRVAAQLSTMLDATGFTDTVTPQLATSNSFTGLLNNNPVLAGAAGSAGSGITLVSGQIPQGWSLVRGSAIGNVNVAITYPSTGRIRMVLDWAGIPAGGDSLQLRQFGVGSIAIGEAAQGFMRCKFDTGSVNFFGLEMRAFLSASTAGKGWTATNGPGATASFGGVANSGVCDSGGIETYVKTPPLKTTRMTADGVTPTNFNFYVMAMLNGTDGSAAVEIERPTLRKV